MSNQRSKRGIALIMVVGLVAVLLVLAVSFALSMRFDRQASDNYLDSAKTRHMLHEAIHGALQDLEASGAYYGAAPNYTTMQTRGRTSAGNATPPTPGDLYDGGISRHFVPKDLEGTASGLNAQWIDLSDGGNTYGRYAYMVLDCSPYLDGRYIDLQSNQPREHGLHGTTEIDCSSLDMFLHANTKSLAEFKTLANQYGRFEGLMELEHALGIDHTLNKPQPANIEAFHRSHVPNGTVAPDATGAYFLYEPNPEVGSNVQPMVDLNAATLDQANAALYLQDMGLTPVEATMLASNIVDYIDLDSIPDSLGGPSVEPVPMFSEVLLKAEFVRADPDSSNPSVFDYEFAVTLGVELFYPYEYQAPLDYSFEVDYQLSPAIPGGAHPGVAQVFTVEDIMETSYSNGFHAVQDAPITIVMEDVPTNPASINAGQIRFSLTVNSALVFEGGTVGGPNVDSLGQGAFRNFTTELESVGEVDEVSFENVDPRFNWEFNNAGSPQWVETDTPSFGSINAVTVAELAKPETDGIPGQQDTAMYTRNDAMNFVSELGYIPYAPWRTLRMFPVGGNDGHPVTDYFVVNTNDLLVARAPLNSTSGGIHAAVFSNMPIDPVMQDSPLLPAILPVTPAQAVTLGDAMAFAADPANGGPFLTVGELTSAKAQVFWDQVDTDFGGSFNSELEKEAFFRNVEHIYATRNGTHLMFIEVQAINNALFNGERVVNGALKAAVHYWRDPYPDPDLNNGAGGHRTQILSIEFLKDDI